MTAKTARIKELFVSALEIASPEQREAFLAEVCQDDRPLRAEVDSLLDAHQRANDFLTTTVSSGLRSLVDPPVDEAIGSQIGPYTIREKIGEGGMGVVYVAEQSRPIKRKVALKLIKPGLESRDVIARFEAERQALALMEHPNIARVLDAGTTPEQRPYFVMELVRGVPITEYCDAAGLRTQDRLKLFMAVCRAVQHAHQKGIIHRDLKPSNVMVTLHDGVPVPKVIDFGVAKALDQQLTDQTAYTQFRQMIGTPAYMSPEQAEMSGLDVDTRSDVYSLGVLLYELLTGTTPFDRQTLKSATFDEMRRIIREDDPLRPSQRVSTLDSATISTIRQRRHVDVRELSRSLKRELDWIVMKSLEKDRNRRYESASALAQDVQRYLHDEPVEACPPSTVYRVQKFVSQHRGFLLAIAGVLVTAILGAGLTSLQAWKAQLAQADAEKHLEAAVSAELETRRLLYATDISLAGQFWANGKVRELTEVLDRTADLSRTGADLRGFEWWLLKQMATSQGKVLTESPEQACLVRRSPDGRYLVIGWTNGSLEVRDGQDFQKLMTFRGGGFFVYGCDFHPDGKQLATLSDDGIIRIWHLEKQRLLKEIPAFQRHGHRVCFSADGQIVAASGESDEVRFFDVETGELLRTIGGFSEGEHEGTERRFACSTNRDRLAIGDHGGITAIYDFSTGKEVCVLEDSNYQTSAMCLRFSPDGEFLVGGIIDRSVRVWDTESGSLIATYRGHLDHVLDVAVSPDGQFIASGDRSGVVRLWKMPDQYAQAADLSQGWPAALQAHDDRVLSIEFSTDGQQLVTGSRDQSVKVFSPPAVSARQTLDVNRPRDVAFFDGGNQLLIGCEQALVVWDKQRGETRRISKFDEHLKSITISNDQRLIATGHYDGAVILWDLASGSQKSCLRTGISRADHLEFSAAGTSLLCGTWDGEPPMLLMIESGQLREVARRFSGYEGGWVSSIAPELLFTQLDELHALDPVNGSILRKYLGHTNTVRAVAFSPRGETFVSGSDDRTVRIWDANTGLLLNTVLAHEQGVVSVAISPDGRTVASGDSRGTVYLSNMTTGRALLRLEMGEGHVLDQEFSPDGRQLAVVQPDRLTLFTVDQVPEFSTRVAEGHKN